ncbi:choline-glycine betaine transporter [Chromobacterium alkanivorans]|uniref:BCCT family transporter n=1 Tax=Chromobacterium TaxID=535 RepID=UPI0006531C7C|nr:MULTISPECIES: BCCT family transporter [Chromobacterium]KMN82595.1 BCCT transporter [Chromobacterium sp. LK11]MBN3005911.1 BCCT family transporter [Chromobacterium alkanivorans]MCS3802408.1 choline-glycine betaine transporter [Chromobacterium alkanivorans]MCS3816735.1 choline-glycine betaine transporter [Chromobacterium alkanivorans]MCS3871774.1 choline-glycine betaine transporter [Chromobacterium alkanivorans]
MHRHHRIKPLVFWPTFLLLLAALLLSYLDLPAFLHLASGANKWILGHFSWLFSLASFSLLLTCGWVYFSPIGKLRIGGEAAQPLLGRKRWFAVTLMTTMAVGVLFWTSAEPIYHLYYPPAAYGLSAGSAEAASFAMSAMFLHWTFTPYAIYTVPALLFGLVFYNLKLPFSVGSMLQPLLGRRVGGRSGHLIDALALYALVAGMASSLGTGALALVGGINQYLPLPASPFSLGLVIAAIVVTFVCSALSGLQRGLTWLSSINTWILLALAGFLLIFGPTTFILAFGLESFGNYLNQFFRLSLSTGAASQDGWAGSWTIFYWAVWFAWAPISAMFLGKISRGYTVREVIVMNLLLPAGFTALWIMIFSGTALSIDLGQAGLLKNVLEQQGVENVLYTIIRQLPMSEIMVAAVVFIAFLNYVTAADSNTDAISNLCTSGFYADSAEKAGKSMKIVWGGVIGLVSWVMTSYAGGVDGVKMMSNLGGLPALLIVMGCMLSLIALVNSGKLERLSASEASAVAKESQS